MVAQELTKRQKAVLDFIIDYIQENQRPPTVREIAEEFGFTVKGAYDYLRVLERKGWIEREGNRSRAIRILEYPDEYDYLQRQKILEEMDIRPIPLVGRIAAGDPIAALATTDEHFVLSAHNLPGSPDDLYFALRVRGDSMIGAGILDGDIVIVRHQHTASHRDIVVALIEGKEKEATLKRYIFTGRGIILKPENPKYEPIKIKDPWELKISGVVVGLYRSLK